MRKPSADESLRCSFCKKGQETVGKLISTPRDCPRAYICDECIATCAAIIEDDRAASQEAEDVPSENIPHPLLNHSLAPALMEAIERWMHEESLGKDGAIALHNVRLLASQMVQQR